MIENTNTKQFYPGPILNNTLEITDFLFNNAEQIKITHSKLNKEGILVDVDLNYPTDYEVTKVLPSDINAAEAALTASTGQIMLKNVKVLAGEKLTVYRISQIIQDKDYPRTGAFPAATHEGALDYLTMQNQEQQEELNRTLKVPISTGKFNAMVPVPLPNRILRIDEKATGFEFVPYDLDKRLDTFEKDTNTTIAQNKQELLQLQDTFEENFEAETNTKIQEFEEEVNDKIQAVADAADRINTLDKDLAIATQAATEASKAASTATNKANEILSVENQFLNKSQITNCILEIPQRIKYELNDGELTINAGSIVTIDGKDYVIPSVPTVNTGTSATQTFIIYEKTRNMLLASMPSGVGSGTALPTNSSSYSFFFNTTDKKVYRWVNNTWSASAGYSLPLMLVTRSSVANQFTSIDKVFNGFGYIGSTIWVDKGVKALIPNGRNVDGTLKNIEITIDSIKTTTFDVGRTNTWFGIYSNKKLALLTSGFYDEKDNYIRQSSDNNNIKTFVPFATGSTDSTGRITEFNPYLTFRAINSNEFNTKVDEINASLNTKVNKAGDTMTGTLTSTANNGNEIHIKGNDTNKWLTIKGTTSNYDYNDYANVPTELIRNLRLISHDKNGIYYFYQQVSAEPSRNICAFHVSRKLTDGTEKKCEFALRVQDTGANTPLINGQPLKAFVTETYVSGTSWYRVWSDGWIEQGGYLITPTTGDYTINFLKSFNNTNYTFTSTYAVDNTGGYYGYEKQDNRTVGSIVVRNYANKGLNWRVCGYIA